MKRSFARSFIFMQIKIIFIRMVSHLDSLWNRGKRELGNGLFHLSILKFFTGSVSVQKNAKALTKKRTKPSSKHCIFLIWGQNIKPKFKAFLPSLERESWAGWWTLQTTIRNNTSIKYDPKQVCKSSFKRLNVIKIENRGAHVRETLDTSDIQHILKELWKVFQHSNSDFRSGLPTSESENW